ncbi:uncharacterized protein LOC133832439 [Humulus lupulus]|uniref:uncharacterized protein LOC133832439 n=1 Tax=Humulus lupulus TaxID=3486 RepID=UPI002B410A59|nr:uncharacterized protein LOC133832439 [Humulus lupulus]
MNAIFWNVQGLGNSWTTKALVSHDHEHKPLVWFMSETRLKKNRMENDQYNNIVQEAWGSNSNDTNGLPLRRKINRRGKKLEGWNKKNSSELKKKIQRMKLEVETLPSLSNREAWMELQKAEKNLRVLLVKEELWWRQRSRALWLQCGDKNTHYFHQKTNKRRDINEIEGMFDTTLHWKTNFEDMENITCDYFENIFTSEVADEEQLKCLDKCVPYKMNNEASNQLLAPFSKEEVKIAMFQVNLLKAPGPDGLPAIVYHLHWDMVGPDVVR